MCTRTDDTLFCTEFCNVTREHDQRRYRERLQGRERGTSRAAEFFIIRKRRKIFLPPCCFIMLAVTTIRNNNNDDMKRSALS